MHFDDRLATVLRHRAAGERAARTQFRQLLDLLGGPVAKRGGTRDESLLAAAWLRLGALGETVPAKDRAAILREPGSRLRNPEIVTHLAEDEPEVAAGALASAELNADDWEALIPRLPIRARGFLRHRRDLPPPTVDLLERLGVHDRGLPEPVAAEASNQDKPQRDVPRAANDQGNDQVDNQAENTAEDQAQDTSEIAESATEDSAIGALVKRIEAFRKSRSSESPIAPRLPLNEIVDDAALAAPFGFAFTTDSAGRINWADPRFAPMVMGASLGLTDLAGPLSRREAIRRMPIMLQGGGAIAGEWVVEADPRFTQADGQFFGYAGTARRPAEARPSAAETAQSQEADRLRQLLHELRTPVNAIQGFSEVIQQQLFGPTPHEYRALAAGIAGDSARMLAGFDELDRLARLESGGLEIEAGETDFAAIITRLTAQLEDVLVPRTASFELTTYGGGVVPINQNEAETMAWRLLATLAGTIGVGEHLQLELTEKDGALLLSCELPANLAAKPNLFAASSKPTGSAVSAGMFGAGFALRLVKAEAAAIGGSLTCVDDWLLLSLPLLTDAERQPSQNAAQNAR